MTGVCVCEMMHGYTCFRVCSNERTYEQTNERSEMQQSYIRVARPYLCTLHDTLIENIKTKEKNMKTTNETLRTQYILPVMVMMRGKKQAKHIK